MEFEYDAEKSRTNADKHGIDFEHARNLWQDAGRLILASKIRERSSVSDDRKDRGSSLHSRLH